MENSPPEQLSPRLSKPLPVPAKEFSWIQPSVSNFYSTTYILRVVGGTIGYLTIQALLQCLAIFIDERIDFELESPTISSYIFSSLFRRTDWDGRVYETTYLSVGQLIYFIGTIILGFTYVNVITLNSVRSHPLFSVREEYTVWNPYIDALPEKYGKLKERRFWSLDSLFFDFKMALAIGFLLYYQSGQMALIHQKMTRGGTCLQDDATKYGRCPSGTDEDIKTSEVFSRNFFAWTLGVYLGLQLTHLDFIPEMDSFKISTEKMKDFDWVRWTVFGGIIVAFISLLALLGYLWLESGVLILFVHLGWLAFAVSFLAVMTWVLSRGFHYHHYFNSLILASFCGHPNVVIAAFHGLACGMFIEGCARWSVSPIYSLKVSSLNPTLLTFLGKVGALSSEAVDKIKNVVAEVEF